MKTTEEIKAWLLIEAIGEDPEVVACHAIDIIIQTQARIDRLEELCASAAEYYRENSGAFSDEDCKETCTDTKCVICEIELALGIQGKSTND